ncbi:MAG: DUF881 domain-containing protein [Bifidobacteriaceae bacterium]|nr:DUF881 domain-containing protein [Bifidobacteriaceae bacterium]
MSVGLVVVLAGWLFAWNAGSNRDSDLRDAPGLRGMVTARDREVEQLQEQQGELAVTVERLVGAAAPNVAAADAEVAMAAGAVAVKGPGITVTLSDANPSADILAEPGSAGSDLLVHQQDIDAVLNALWAGGAEAAAVQGHRLASNTAIRCVGNVILVGGRVYSPPYSITAIGPVREMHNRLDSAPLVRAYRERASRVGASWSTVDEGELTIAGDLAVGPALKYAKALDQEGAGSP